MTGLKHYDQYIGGQWAPAQSGQRLETVNPFTGQPWATVPRADAADVDRAVQAARAAFDTGPWGRMTGQERGRLMRRLAAVIAEHADEVAAVEVTDNGKLIREMAGQIQGLPDYYEYFAGAADKIHGETIPADRSNFFIYTVREPTGVVGAITPWNSPVLLMSWKLAPALAAGCTFVVKPAEQAPASTLEFARLVEEAGFPPGVFNVVTGLGPEAGAPLTEHPGVDKVAFTGSTATGVRVMKGAAGHLARVSLELGGKSPNIVFADADLDAAANGVVAGIFAATGQTCMAGSRLLVQAEVYDELVDRIAARAGQIRMGDPLDPATEMGPVAFAGHLEKVQDCIATGVDSGARLVTGGRGPRRPSWRPATSSSPPCSARSTTPCPSRRRRSSARCWPPSGSPTRPRRWPSPTPAPTAWPPASGPATCSAPTAWPWACAPGPSGSTPTAAWAPWPRSAASRPAASAARTAWPRWRSTPS